MSELRPDDRKAAEWSDEIPDEEELPDDASVQVWPDGAVRNECAPDNEV